MAEEEGKSVADSVLDSIAETINHLIMPGGSHGHGPSKPSFFEKWFGIHSWVSFVGDWAISRGAFLVSVFIALQFAAMAIFPMYARLTAGWILFLLPIMAPVGFGIGFWAAWIWYAQSLYIFRRTNPVLLEVLMPHEVEKSPAAMEQVLTSFWIRAGETTFIDRNWHGGARPYTSLELVSFGGEIHFYIWCRSSYRNVIEAAMYAQYPEVEIVEVEDYASRFEYDPNKHHCFVTDYIYAQEHDKEISKEITNVYPIKTYEDFELEEVEEFTVDPYASVLEVLNTIKGEEQIWIQIVMRGYFGSAWHTKLHHEVERIRREASKQEYVDEETGEIKLKVGGFPRPTETQKMQMEAIERQLEKLPFQVGLRGIYIAPAGKMRSAEYTAFRWIWRPFNDPYTLAQLRPRRAHNDFDYLYQDWGQGPDGVRWQLTTRRYFDAYRRRQFWHAPWIWPEMYMTTETIATLWHPPSHAVAAPGLHRLHAAKAEAPSNLPM